VSEIALAAPLPRRIPLPLKVALTVFVAVQVVVYWSAWGPTNFLYFCDVALFLTLITVLTENPLPASMAAAGILLPQMLWILDFVGTLFGHPLVGLAGYMFKADEPLLARVISLFHGWLPLLLLYLMHRLGYDRRGLAAWMILAWTLMLISYFFLPAPPAPQDQPGLPVNVDFVFGPTDDKPQEWMPPLAWLILVMTALPVVFFIPGHLLLSWRCRKPHRIKTIVAVDPPPADGLAAPHGTITTGLLPSVQKSDRTPA
jgi:hypothetical protein